MTSLQARWATLPSRTRLLLSGTAIALLGLLAQLPIHDRSLVPMDEGHLATAAVWMSDGKLLYRDIHTGIFPGIYLIIRGLFEIFGPNLLVTRWAAVAMNVVIMLTLWRVAERSCLRERWAFLPPVLHASLVVIAFPVLSMFNYSTVSICFGLLGLLLTLRYLETGRRMDALLLGLAVAAAGVTKQNFGALTFVSLAIVLFWNRSRSALGDRSLFAAFWPIALGGGALSFAVIGHFALAGTLPDLIDSTIIELGGSQLRDFNNPVPPILGPHPRNDGLFLFLYSPATVFASLIRNEPWAGIPLTPLARSLAIRASYGIPLLALFAGPVLVFFRRRRDAVARHGAARGVALYALLAAPGILPSAVWSHLAFIVIPILPLFAIIADRVDDVLAQHIRWRRAWRGGIGLLLLECALCIALVGPDTARRNPVPLDLERAPLKVSERLAGLFLGSLRFVEECAEPGAPIFVAPDVPVVYFLTGRASPSPYDLTIPGNVDGALIARRLEQTRTRCVVYNPQMYPQFPPFARLFPRLARYLESHYHKAEEISGGPDAWWGLVRNGSR